MLVHGLVRYETPSRYGMGHPVLDGTGWYGKSIFGIIYFKLVSSYQYALVGAANTLELFEHLTLGVFTYWLMGKETTLLKSETK